MIRRAKEAINGIDPVDAHRTYRFEQGFTFELTLADGVTVGIGGWGSRRKPMALVRAITGVVEQARKVIERLGTLWPRGPGVRA